MKKVISACLCALLVMSVFCFGVSAKSNKESTLAQIDITDVTGNPGNNVFVNVKISNNSNIVDYVLALNFDKSVLSYTGYVEGDLSDYTLYEHADEGKITLVSLNGKTNLDNGTIITYKFNVNKKAKAGKYGFAFSKASFADKNGKLQSAAIKAGKITVAKACKSEHAFSEWETAVAATCTRIGTDIRTCKKCGCTESKSVAEKGHKLSPTFTVDVEAKGDNPGMLSRHCSECGAKTNIIIYTKDNDVGLGINDMVGKISDNSISNLVYFINGNVTYPEITGDDIDINSIVENNQSPVNEDGSINAASAIDRILRKCFGSDKKSGIVGSIKRAAMADEIPLKLLGKLICFILS